MGVGGEGLSFNPQQSLPTSLADHVKGNGPCLVSCLRKQSNTALSTKPHEHTNTTLWKSSAVLFQVFILHSRVVMTDQEGMTLPRVRQRSWHIRSASCLPIKRAPKTGTVPKETPPDTVILTSHCNEFGIHYLTYKKKTYITRLLHTCGFSKRFKYSSNDPSINCKKGKRPIRNPSKVTFFTVKY